MSVSSFLAKLGPLGSILIFLGSGIRSAIHSYDSEWKIQGPVSGYYQIRPPQHFDPCEIRFDVRS